jgi:FMN phosphatase YigB (HAD superfamily)
MGDAAAEQWILLLDMMGTVVREPFVEDVPRFFGKSMQELLPLLSREAWFEFERGEIDEPTFASRFFCDGRSFDCEGLKAVLVAGYEFVPGMRELLVDLQARGVATHALSNYPVWYRLIEDKLHISQLMEWTFVSCKTGVRKPDPDAYLGAARALGARTERCVFVDDRGANCKAAAQVGMTAFRFESAARLRIELAALGVLENVSEPPGAP